MLLRVLFGYLAIGCICLAEEHAKTERATLQLGVAYQSKGDGNWVAVGEILPRAALSGTTGWVQVKPLESDFKMTIGTARRTECVNGRWCTREWKVDLIGVSGTVSAIEGVHELPEILNRPLSGDISVRSEELKISQLQRQVSEAIASSDSTLPCALCVSLTSLENPCLSMHGYSSTDSAASIAQVYAKRIGVRLDGVKGPDKSSDYLAQLSGTVTVAANLRQLKDTVPRFGRDKLFYLDDAEVQVQIAADSDTAKMVLSRK